MWELAMETAWPPMAAAFFASLIEWLGALGLVLALGAEYGRHQVSAGACLAVLVLVSLTVALTVVAWFAPTDLVQLILGTLLLLFGLRLLRDAVLRAGGAIDGQEREAASTRAVVRLRWNSRSGTANSAAIVVASVVTLLTPNVAAISFVVMAIAAAGRGIVPPVVGALIALFPVAPLGLALYRWPTQLPRIVLGFLAGSWLAGFGAFWSAKGIGVSWLGEDAAILVLVGAFAGMGLILVPLVRSRVSGVV